MSLCAYGRATFEAMMGQVTVQDGVIVKLLLGVLRADLEDIQEQRPTSAPSAGDPTVL